ncbi:DUF4407 domain-containing protein [Psychroflexus salis]|nr:DUF4407 domain-containing protein [Psychroflexus salis]
MKQKTNELSKTAQFFLFSSGVSLNLIKQCPQYEINKYISIGVTILFTTLLSSLSAYFAFSYIFENQYLVVGASALWAGVIFNLDRYIVSSLSSGTEKKNNFLKAIPRLIIAILIAFVISKPIEIKLFKNEINTYLEMQKLETINQKNKQYSASILEIQNQKDELEGKLEDKIIKRDAYYSEFKCECDGTCGTGIKGRGSECESRQKKYEDYKAEVAMFKLKTDSVITSLSGQQKIIRNKLDNEIQLIKNEFKPGLFDRIRALEQIDKLASIFILLIFIMIETAPILTKLLSSKGPYENLIEKSDLSFEAQLQSLKDEYKYQRIKQNKIKQAELELEINNKETELKTKMINDAHARYQKLQNELQNKNF